MDKEASMKFNHIIFIYINETHKTKLTIAILTAKVYVINMYVSIQLQGILRFFHVSKIRLTRLSVLN